jgi:regulator of RNase E activity RraA
MAALAEQLSACSTSSVSDALDDLKIGRGGLIEGLRVLGRRPRAAGPIETVLADVELVPRYRVDEFSIGDQIQMTEPGAILFIDALGKPVSNWGELATHAAMRRGLAAAVVRGGMRDVDEVEALEFLLAAAHVTPLTGKGRVRYAQRGAALRWGGVGIEPGDWAIADRTGIVVVPADVAQQVAHRAAEIEAADRQFARLLAQGVSFEDARRRLGHF